MMLRACIAAALWAGPALAQSPAETWISAGLEFATRTVEAGQWRSAQGEVLAVDPLTLYGSEGPVITVPTGIARVVGFRETGADGRTAVLALIWSNAKIVCGEDLSTIGVDTGLAAFLSPGSIAALEAYAKDYGGDLYQGPYADQIDAMGPGPAVIDLPGGLRFPISGSGWGDGGYPVAALHDAKGNMVALYSQFITDGAEWLLPERCAATSS